MNLLIVVPTLNSSDTLPRLLASLQSQTWPHWRLLFIDGPSGRDHRRWLENCCASEPRCSWLVQDPAEPGIFGAMNQGFALSKPNEWLLFWGSDDWAAAPSVFAQLDSALKTASSLKRLPDLLVCRGRYADFTTRALGRSTVFKPSSLLDSSTFRFSLFLGSTPPHQPTLFGPGARLRLARYASGFRLSADLDYFLQLSTYPGLLVQCLDLELVHMSDGGVSGKQTQRRLREVVRAYRRLFGCFWWFPFLMRYLRRLASLILWIR